MNRLKKWLCRRRRARELNATPRFVWCLRRNEIFVFGCRRSGRHYDGASRYARIHFGAKFGKSEGLYGRSYAIPTVGLPLDEIRLAIERFTEYAREHPEQTFLYPSEIGRLLRGVFESYLCNQKRHVQFE